MNAEHDCICDFPADCNGSGSRDCTGCGGDLCVCAQSYGGGCSVECSDFGGCAMCPRDDPPHDGFDDLPDGATDR